MDGSLLKKIIIPIVFIGVLGYFGYVLFVRPPTASLFEVVEVTNTNDSPTGEEILVIIGKLKNLSVDQAIFSSESFTRLKDFGLALVPEPQGRSNPFAPIGNEGQSVSSQATSTRTR